jgi:hypothetical protein
MAMSTTGRLTRTALIAIAVAATAPAALAATVSGLKPVTPAPSDEATAPGLAVEYLNIKVRHVDEVEAAGKGKPGEPIPALDYNSGDGEVLSSGRDDEVGARITGYLHFPAPGTYIMTIQSNDGVRMTLDGQVVIEDPSVHSDQYSPYVEVAIAEAGWYPLYLVYFERKGTATLELYWQPPGAANFELVPAAMFRHPK